MAMQTTQQILLDVFQSVDVNSTGTINDVELKLAMRKGGLEEFDTQTARMMIAIFDKERKRAINCDEFIKLFRFQDKWQTSFDNAESGAINNDQFVEALASLGYHMSPEVVVALMKKYDTHKIGMIKKDDFMKCAVLLNALDTTFRERDTDQGREITVAFEDLLSLVVTKILL